MIAFDCRMSSKAARSAAAKRRFTGKRRQRYAVRNWPAYDRALTRRGELSVRISPEALDAWR